VPLSAIISSLLPDSEVNQIGPTEDDVSILWLADSTPANTATAVGMLQTGTNPVLGAYNGGEVFWGPSLELPESLGLACPATEHDRQVGRA